MRLVQIEWQGKARAAMVSSDDELTLVEGDKTVYALALEAIAKQQPLADHVLNSLSTVTVNYSQSAKEGKLLPPVMHPDLSRCMVSGTGLTHLGSAESRHSMHAGESGVDEQGTTDSMRMFKLGIDNGKPAEGKIGAQPEWFYKGDGHSIVSPGRSLPTPRWALDASEEPEVAGIYIIADDGTPYRIGFALGNEFSDHVTEKANYLWLAHSKLRYSSFGPELLLGELPRNMEGYSRIERDGETVWQKSFLTGEDNMCHSLANLEHHHFKYHQFCQPGDMHVHYFGTATLSFGDGFRTQEGDCFEISIAEFGKPLRNRMVKVDTPAITTVNVL